MKKNISLLIIILIIVSAFFFTGCQEKGLSINDRIKAFISDLNNPIRSNSFFKEHFHSDSGVYDTGEAATINNAFPADHIPYSSSISGSGSSRTVIIYSSGDTAGIYIFNMKEEDSDDWYILSISGPVNLN